MEKCRTGPSAIAVAAMFGDDGSVKLITGSATEAEDGLATRTTLLSVSVLIEEDANEAARAGWRWSAEGEVQKAVLAAVAVLLRNRPDVRVEWASSMSMPLDGKPW